MSCQSVILWLTFCRSALDFNPMNTIASHVSYWADEDVNHFVLSQLLSGKPKAKQDKT